jgi:hypothetical protein
VLLLVRLLLPVLLLHCYLTQAPLLLLMCVCKEDVKQAR